MEREYRRLRQLIPAAGWFAVRFTQEPPYYALDRLVAWGRFEWDPPERHDDDWTVEGLTARDYVDTTSGDLQFSHYMHEADITDEARASWTKEGERQHRGKG